MLFEKLCKCMKFTLMINVNVLVFIFLYFTKVKCGKSKY